MVKVSSVNPRQHLINGTWYDICATDTGVYLDGVLVIGADGRRPYPLPFLPTKVIEIVNDMFRRFFQVEKEGE